METKQTAPVTPEPGSLTLWPVYDAPGEGDRLFFWPDREGCPPNAFTLRIDGGSAERPGQLIGNVIINPAFDKDTVDRFRWLFSMANELWQATMNLAKSTHDLDLAPVVKEAFNVLWQTSGINPLCPDDNRRRASNAHALASLPCDVSGKEAWDAINQKAGE